MTLDRIKAIGAQEVFEDGFESEFSRRLVDLVSSSAEWRACLEQDLKDPLDHQRRRRRPLHALRAME